MSSKDKAKQKKESGPSSSDPYSEVEDINYK